MSSESTDERRNEGDVTENAVLDVFRYDNYQYSTEDVARGVGASVEAVEPVLEDLEQRGDLSRIDELQATLWELKADTANTSKR